MTPDVDQKVMDRIAKLLALAGNNPSAEEAALALQRAQELMKQHGVTTSDAEVGPIHEHPLRSWASARKTKDYELILFGGIARVFGCELLFKAGVGRAGIEAERYFAHYIFVGPSTDVKVALYAATNLSRAMRKARAKYLEQRKLDFIDIHLDRRPTRGWLAQKGDAYCEGWASEVIKKVEPLVRPEVAERVKRRVDELVMGRKEAKSKRSRTDWVAREDGCRDGSEVQVHKPLQ